MRSILRSIVGLALAALVTAPAPGGASVRGDIARARDYIASGRHDDAAIALDRVLTEARGDARQEALFLRAGVETSADAAVSGWRRVIDEDPRSEWAARSRLELAKIRYALGDYQGAYGLLAENDACGSLPEACLFEGLSAIMLKRYDDAMGPLATIRRGRLRTWAYLSLAEAEMGRANKDEACRRYEALSSAMISPTALYRYAECLEDRGDVDAARREYREVIDSFRDTPEAVLAAEKLQVVTRPAPPVSTPEPAPSQEKEHGMAVLESGFTLQFGAFRDRANAIKMASKIKRVYPGVRIDSELISYREHFRVRYGYFRTREEARATGEQISREIGEDYTIMTLP